jgi:hypothetical protein
LKSFVIQIQKYGRTDQLMGLEPFHFDNWLSGDNTYINKHTRVEASLGMFVYICIVA